jgi:hypothetical protein
MINLDIDPRLEVGRLLNEHQASKLLGITVHLLRKWRNVTKAGPKPVYFNGRVFYNIDTLAEYKKQKRVISC